MSGDASIGARERKQTRRARKLRAKSVPKEEREYGDDLNKLQPKPDYHSAFLEHCDNNRNLVPSSKLETVMAYIRKWQREAPDDKIIGKFRSGFELPFRTIGVLTDLSTLVFTQWRLFGMILGRKLYEEDIGFLYHFGTLSMKERDKAAADFRDDPDAKVLVRSLNPQLFPKGAATLTLTTRTPDLRFPMWRRLAKPDLRQPRHPRRPLVEHGAGGAGLRPSQTHWPREANTFCAHHGALDDRHPTTRPPGAQEEGMRYHL